MSRQHSIILKKVKVHNLKEVDLTLKSNELIVFTGVSGSGKSSLAFDTIYVEGQRRYIESLSAFARRYLGDLSKPDLESISGLSPTIAIEQKTAGKNPRSTVGTMTEIYDYLRLLYARVGIPHCPVSGEPVQPQSKEKIIKTVQSLPEPTKILILAPFARSKKGEFKEDFQLFLRKGFMRVRLDGALVDISEEIDLDKNKAHDIDIVIDRMVVTEANHSRIAEAVTTALEMGKGTLSVYDPEQDQETLYSTHAYSPKSGISYSALEPQDFSFNSPTGMCQKCSGLGFTQTFDLEKIIDPEKSIAEDCCSIASSYQTVRYGNIYQNLAKIYGFSLSTPWKKLTDKAKQIFLYGAEKKWLSMHFVHPTKPTSWTDYIQWRGVIEEAFYRYTEAKSELYRSKMEALMHQGLCSDCQGSRLRAYPSSTLLNGLKIHELCRLDVASALNFFEKLTLANSDQIVADEPLKEIKRRLKFLLDVGLHYLTLERTAPTLSGGEAQRVRLASQVGSGLVGVTYILDEPSIGLHPRDNQKLISTLKHLRDVGNTVIVVEHDEETIWEADRIVDFGPGPGRSGGQVLVNGTIRELLQNKQSLTAAYLNGKKSIAIPKKRRALEKESIQIIGASHHNLKKINVTFPLGVMIAITGVSGSGKSSLITDTLFPALANHLHHAQQPVGQYVKMAGMELIDKVIAIDQTPIGRTPRSNPATYIKIFDDIRSLFSKLPDSVAKGFQPGRFSFNVQDGTCGHCHGIGMVRIDMDFLEDQWVSCPTCQNRRFDHETLSIRYKGKNIHDVLEMTALEAGNFFSNIPTLKRKLELLCQVGMEYIQLGQPSTTLSGGEAQRIKLAKELVRPSTGRTFYILDEPTTGLHFHDINALLKVMHELVEKGNTVLVIEHNMDVIKTADWIIDLGPEGGHEGGEIVATGTPEQIASLKTPTAHALQRALFPPQQTVTKKERSKATPIRSITIQGATQNNLKQINLKIPRGQLTICTGPSGSGKSSLAFETVYAEGQRRYIESLSPYARQFVHQMPKPKVGQIEGLSPAIAIEQKATAGNPRSTIGTLTEIYDYLRILFAHIGTAYCPETGEEIKTITKEVVVDRILSYPQGEKLTILAPLQLQKQDRFEDFLARLRRQGFVRIRVNGLFYELDETIPLDPKRKNELALVIDRIIVSQHSKARLFEAVENASKLGEGKILVAKEKEDILFNLAFAVESTGKSYPEITPHTFAFNSHEGMCPDCQGLGYQYGADLTRNREVMELSILGLTGFLWSHHSFEPFEIFLKKEKIDPYTPLRELTDSQLQLLLNGSSEEKWITTKKGYRFRWLGIQNILAKAGKVAQSQIRAPLIALLEEIQCHSCLGTRLNPLARNVFIQNLSLPKLCCLPCEKTLEFILQLQIPKKFEKLLEDLIKQLKNRLQFLVEIGLEYLSLDRSAPSLSNGEAQRIRLARQLGSQLNGVLYVLDEPTIGLHPYNNDKLNQALKRLKELGNTLLMVEHDPQTVATADWIIDFGPGAGVEGGHVIAQGTYPQILKNHDSLTGAYLSGRKTVEIPKKRRKPKGYFAIRNAHQHNLKNLSFELPLGVLTCITGVSGSGKSTLMHDEIRPRVEKMLPTMEPFDKLIIINQDPIGTTARSDVGTYVDLLPKLREFYAALGASRTRGLQPKHFSYNHRQGMCTTCWGMGYKKVEMLFLPPVKIVCDQCQGLRLNPLSLTVEYEGKNFGNILDLTVDQARLQFSILPKACRILDTLISVGLGYLKLGQEMASLSGGEAQRMKLSRELSRRASGKTLYLLDEPTTGLHSEDIKKLLHVLHRLVDKGNTMVIIEHNLDMIRNADHLIDIGPGAGINGGEMICSGTPEVVANNQNSLTAKYINKS